MQRAQILLIALTTVTMLAACDHRDNRERPRDDEAVHSERREVGSFKAIDLRGDARIEIAVGAAESVTIEGRSTVVRRIATDVRGETLHIRTKRGDWLWTNGDPRVTLRITVPKLDALNLRGGNEVHLTGFDGGDSRIKVEGAASIEADGRLDELTVHVAGAGQADFSKLEAVAAKVTVDGVGSVHVNSKESLDATMNGVGAIYYSGDPRDVNTSMKGFGTIAQKDSRNSAKDGAERDGPRTPVDPETLQPEYEKEPRMQKKLEHITPTEVI